MQDLKTKDIVYLPGVGPARSKLLKEQLNIHTWHDLLYYFPYKHIDRTRLYRINELTSDMPFVQVKGRFLSFEEMGAGRKKRLVGHFTDGQSLMDLVWFNATKYITKTIKLNRDYIIFGRPGVFNGRLQVSHPDVDPAESLALGKMGMQPYYSVTEKMKKAGLSSRSLEHFTQTLFQQMQEPIGETLPEYLVRQMYLMPLGQALKSAHYPETANELSHAMLRLKFEELFYVQLSILRYARERHSLRRGIIFPRVGENFHTFYNHYLPFPLTDAQKRVIREMRTDMGSGKQMNRLLQRLSRVPDGANGNSG